MNQDATATIVVGVDGSEHAQRSLAWAIEEAKLRDARLHLVSAWHVPRALYSGAAFVPPISTSIDDCFRELAEEAVEAAAEKARDASIEARTTVREGHPADVLIDEAATAVLLVVGSRGLGGFAGLLLGSVSAHCAHHAPCPLVIVR